MVEMGIGTYVWGHSSRLNNISEGVQVGNIFIAIISEGFFVFNSGFLVNFPRKQKSPKNKQTNEMYMYFAYL
jgi:hypothetical protein